MRPRTSRPGGVRSRRSDRRSPIRVFRLWRAIARSDGRVDGKADLRHTDSGNETLTLVPGANGTLHIAVHGYAASAFKLTTADN